MKNQQDIEDSIDYMKSMMESCYTYGGIEKTSYNYERYILKYRDELGARLFNKVYKEKAEELSGYRVEPCTYTDCDGLTYNSLVKIQL